MRNNVGEVAKMDRWLLKRGQAHPTEDEHAKKQKKNRASKIPPVS